MTREEALAHLNCAPDAGRDEIEKAYQRMVRRYPPEFHPDRFRLVDESYRMLTSLSFLLESLLSPRKTDPSVEEIISELHAVAEPDAVEKSIQDIRKVLVMEVLWPGGTAR